LTNSARNVAASSCVRCSTGEVSTQQSNYPFHQRLGVGGKFRNFIGRRRCKLYRQCGQDLAGHGEHGDKLHHSFVIISICVHWRCPGPARP
jgi:hypothetical protein